MGGATSLRGLITYQQRYVAHRVLSELAVRTMTASVQGKQVVGFAVEGKGNANAPIWDVLLSYSDKTVDLHECKDTAITRDDRLAFYRRIRSEIASGTAATEISPVWVTDPTKQSANILASIEAIPTLVPTVSFRSVAKTLPGEVRSGNAALQEAIFQLCHEPKAKAGCRACTPTEAKVVLARLRIDRRTLDELDRSVRLLATGVFTTGTTNAIVSHITGTLTERIAKKGEAKFSVPQFLTAVKVKTLTLKAEGRIRKLFNFNAGDGYFTGPRLVQWSRLKNSPRTKWPLVDRVPGYDSNRSWVLSAAMGMGKTVASQMAFEESAAVDGREASHVLRVEARTLEGADLDALLHLACMLAGTGPTWLAIDGLDEVPGAVRKKWEQTLPDLMALPQLALFLTVRREVLAVQPWLATVLTPLDKLEMSILSEKQVTLAFEDVGLHAPKNPELLRALRNPFVLSLYAGIVTKSELPLDMSGEVAAFQVIEEFWTQRVRGVSEGQRAVGPSATSQEPKRKAAEYLTARTLAGDTAMKRGRSGAEVAKGIEMLLREGVVEERGPDAVAWVHDWLREYALVSKLRADLGTQTATALAERVASCTPDHVARAAASGGIKWVLANPASGRPEDYLGELGRLNPGLMRDALAIVLEGPPDTLKLADLAEDVLHEAVTLASHMGATQWGTQIASLPDALLAGARGPDLHAITIHYEIELAPAATQVDGSVVRRLVARDLARWRGGQFPLGKAFFSLLKAIEATQAYRDSAIREWLTHAAGQVGDFPSTELMKLVLEMVKGGLTDEAIAIFRAVVGLDSATRGEQMFNALVRRRSLLQRSIEELLQVAGLLTAHVGTWGATIAEFFGRLLAAGQEERWPSNRRRLEAVAKATNSAAPEATFEPSYDEDPRIWSVGSHGRSEFFTAVSGSFEAALRDFASLPTATRFQAFSERLIQLRYASAVTLPLFALLDAGNSKGSQKPWHARTVAAILCDERVASLKSLEPARRLLRRSYTKKWKSDRRQQIVAAIRSFAKHDRSRIRELSDCRDWTLLTTTEEAAVEKVEQENELYEPRDIRREQLFTTGRFHPEPEPEKPTGWPHSEDEHHVRALQQLTRRSATQGRLNDEDVPAVLRALEVVARRPAAKSDRWIGTVLDWCQIAVSDQRARLETDASGARNAMRPADWEKTLTERTPWWREMVDAAIARLTTPPPSEHFKRGADGHLGWGSDDPILNAAHFLDDTLAIERELPFAEMQPRFADTVQKQWPSWPPFTRATVLFRLRTWFWVEFPQLRSVFGATLESEPSTVATEVAVRHALEVAPSRSVPEFAKFIDRATQGGHENALQATATVLGQAAVLVSSPTATDRMKELGQLYNRALAADWKTSERKGSVFSAVLWGATGVIREMSWPGSTDAWLKVAQKVIDDWPHAGDDAFDQHDFPVHTLFMAFESEWSARECGEVLEKLVPGLQKLFRCGTLGDLADFHFSFRELVTGDRHARLSGGAGATRTAIDASVERVAPQIVRAAADRIAQWRRENKESNDLGWGGALSGQETVELMKLVIDRGRDRARLAQEFMPSIDVLADAGLTGTAASARAYIRTLVG